MKRKDGRILTTTEKTGIYPTTPVNGNKKQDLTFNAKDFVTMLSMIESRSQLATRAGKSFGNDRNIYRSLGYRDILTFEDFWSQYTRENISKRIIEAYPIDTWRLRPQVSQKKDKPEGKTEFEKAWETLAKERKIFHYLVRVDKLSGIGSYGVLLMGFDDVDGETTTLESPVTKANKLLFLRPFKQDNATVHTFVNDISDERYGLPEFYNINLTSSNRIGITNKDKKKKTKNTHVNQTKKVHWSRILHVAEDLLEDDVNAVPRLQPIFNVLKSLELIVGGSGEMFWRGAFPGLAFKLDKDAQLDPNQGAEALEDMIQKYMHNLQRHLKLQGMDVQNLAPQVADPSKHFDMFMSVISATIGMPKRILLGTERGELASDQDERAWNDKIQERQLNYAEPMLLREFITRLQMVGILPDVKAEDYEVTWPPLKVAGEKEKAEVAKLATEALAAYANSIGVEDIMPRDVYFKEILKLEQEVIDQINQLVGKMVEDENVDAEADAKELEDFRRIKRQTERDEEFDEEDST